MAILDTLKKVGANAAMATGNPLLSAALRLVPTGKKPAAPTAPALNMSVEAPAPAKVPSLATPTSSAFLAPAMPSLGSSGTTTKALPTKPTPAPTVTKPVVPTWLGSTSTVPTAPTQTVTPVNTSYVAPAVPSIQPAASGSIPFKPGLSDAQQASISSLASKPASQWSDTDRKNWAYATNNAAIPSAAIPSQASSSGAPTMPTVPTVGSGNATPEAPVAPFTPPVAPTMSAAQKAAADAEAAYRKNLEMTPEEMATQRELDQLSESARTGYRLTENQTIPLEFITGQQRAIEQRALGLAEPLSAKAARLQAQRMASLNASKFALDRADQAVSDEKAAAAEAKKAENPMEVGGNLVKYNAKTGKYETVYSAPEKPAEGFTLGEGQSRYDAQGNLIASGPAKSTVSGDAPDIKTINGQSMIWDAASGIYKPAPVSQAVDQAKVQKAQDVLSLATELLNSGDTLGNAVGPVSSWLPTFRGKSADFEAKTNRLKSLLTLENLGVLKGAISDRDMEVLSSAASALSLGMSEQGFKNELQNIINKMSGVISGGNNQQSQQGGDALDSILDEYAPRANAPAQTSGVKTGMRTDRHNNPTAMTTDVARTAGLKEGVDYVLGDPFPNNPNLRTAVLLGDPVATTIKAIDSMGFYTQSGKPRWDYISMPKSKWDSLSYDQKRQVIGQMYQREGGTALKSLFA